jgi:hypothetical protein
MGLGAGGARSDWLADGDIRRIEVEPGMWVEVKMSRRIENIVGGGQIRLETGETCTGRIFASRYGTDEWPGGGA